MDTSTFNPCQRELFSWLRRLYPLPPDPDDPYQYPICGMLNEPGGSSLDDEVNEFYEEYIRYFGPSIRKEGVKMLGYPYPPCQATIDTTFIRMALGPPTCSNNNFNRYRIKSKHRSGPCPYDLSDYYGHEWRCRAEHFDYCSALHVKYDADGIVNYTAFF